MPSHSESGSTNATYSALGSACSLGCSGVDTPCLGVVHRPPAFGTHGPGEGRLPLDALDIQVAELGAEVAVRHGPANAVFVRRLDRYDRPLDAHVGIERRLFGLHAKAEALRLVQQLALQRVGARGDPDVAAGLVAVPD